MIRFYLFLLLTLVVGACDSNSSEDSRFGRSVTDDYDVLDGEFCAEVEYYNPNTGTNSTYTLNVLVEDDYLVEIYWANGGRLDTDHFYAEHIGDGYCSFTSDKGYEYEVTLNGDPCSFTNTRSLYYQQRIDQEEITCPRCGDEKDSYDDYCDYCEDEIENTCSRCGGHEYYVYGGLCSYCEEEEYDDW